MNEEWLEWIEEQDLPQLRQSLALRQELLYRNPGNKEELEKEIGVIRVLMKHRHGE